MPHDANGSELVAGDLVTIQGKVTSVSAGEKFCNVTVQVVDQIDATAEDYKPTISFNSKLVTKNDVPDPKTPSEDKELVNVER